MKKAAYILTALLLMSLTQNISAQNLVPNFSFELKTACPTNADQTSLLTDWSKYSATVSTPDYYNVCSPSSTVGIPQSSSIYQTEKRGCTGYIGLVTWATTPNDREHLGTQLTQPLVIGQKYFISFNTVMGGGFFAGDYMESPSNNIGMRLSTIPFNPSNPAPIDNFSHLRSVSIITDTLNWVRVTGSIVADSAYNYLILGNFYDDSNTDTLTLNCGVCQNWYSYYLIDDVCISTDSILCNGGIDILPCNVSVEEFDLSSQFSFWPNPANELFNIRQNLESSPYDITIHNSLGQVLYKEDNIISKNAQFDISDYSNGLIFIKINSNNNSFTYKLLKN